MAERFPHRYSSTVGKSSVSLGFTLTDAASTSYTAVVTHRPSFFARSNRDTPTHALLIVIGDSTPRWFWL